MTGRLQEKAVQAWPGPDGDPHKVGTGMPTSEASGTLPLS